MRNISSPQAFEPRTVQQVTIPTELIPAYTSSNQETKQYLSLFYSGTHTDLYRFVVGKREGKSPLVRSRRRWKDNINLLTPNDPYRGRTAPLTSKRCILYIYSTNIGNENFKHCIYSPFFFSECSLFHNSNLFGSCIIHILYTGCAKIKKKIPAPKG